MDDVNNHNGFKLIGIVPLKDCNQKFRKNLKIGTPYLLYNNYTVELNDKNSSVNAITVNRCNVPNTMYNLDNGIKINISAVVGKNGSGKSALIELFYYFVYAISSLKEDDEIGLQKYSNIVQDKLKLLERDIKFINSEKENYSLGIQYQEKYNIQVILKNKKSNYKNSLLQSLNDKLHLIKNTYNEALENENLIQKELNMALIYELENHIYILEFINGKLTCKDYKGLNISSNFKFDKFFYSINLNYSHHSLNSNIIGGWIDTLFHKNDGYKTPVVINPMRDEGIYDINNELNLSKERLMFNLAYYLVKSQNNKEEYKLLDKYKIRTINFSIKPKSYPALLNFNNDGLQQSSSHFLIKNIVNENNFAKIKHFDIAVGYLERKLKKIRRNYHSIIFKEFDSSSQSEEEYFQNFILEDNSHITKKIKQVVNYIRYAENSKKLDAIFQLEVLKTCSFTSDEFVAFILENKSHSEEEKSNSLNVLELMNYLPPSIFNIDFELSIVDKERILLSQLSSGEQQMIFNINTVLYHLYNLQSSFSSKNTRLVYKNVSIILDEIELYYHPEMQRQILKNILDSLELIKTKENEGIESINICFLTHSPFILSDIPSQNILKLNEGKPESTDKINSFAANIYDLLKDEFFLENGAIGAFVSKKINDILIKDPIEEEDWSIINLVGDPFLKGVIKKKIEDKLSDDALKKEIERLQKIKQKRSKNDTN
ncbi:hypothetical protein SAMN05443634_103214 [Chishuiella changwenlii]|uniref:AAA ATPase domain-containing protein n=1 Tax=Chishuiella changwenlii TaxID=1434701 RepID=A0A1M6V7I5_9FLAO|nr:ATP-binding protein [Chishuiella changwenlii]GGF01666.1 hypothetical protein GCM10010984_18850 [Chishuiella changwenlii]SHK77355.1 hypothetical protein SAMN05443634_103214 [Chishuiella changwenlii]